ncbi:hypothetical protein LHP98_14210 [Rhodobacter sp. Har01]|uniref:hypothetical protein n=1 Tax=Rhodobacter sp. Har01 TaxID=2883999 RepID=UPI001D0698B6|nr:hypothetical protein [Rhodobacter sp. Har01]MCB6179274.1 hypothetical protein [Rhodobacter sp. Har01]
MTQLRDGPGIGAKAAVPAPVSAAFASAIGDYARVLRGQSLSVATLCDEVTTHWLQGASDLLADLDLLRADLDGLQGEAALRARVAAFTEATGAGLTGLMIEVQRQDMVRQMLETIARMADAIGALDLASLVASAEAAALPRLIVEDIAAGYVMAAQRQVQAAALHQASQDDGPAMELF